MSSIFIIMNPCFQLFLLTFYKSLVWLFPISFLINFLNHKSYSLTNTKSKKNPEFRQHLFINWIFFSVCLAQLCLQSYQDCSLWHTPCFIMLDLSKFKPFQNWFAKNSCQLFEQRSNCYLFIILLDPFYNGWIVKGNENIPLIHEAK